MIKTRLPANFDYGSKIKSRYNPRLGIQVHEFTYKTQVIFGSIGSNLTFKTLINGTVVSTVEIVFDQN